MNKHNLKMYKAASKRREMFLRLLNKTNPETGKKYTQEEIGRKYGLTRQRVNQIIAKARVDNVVYNKCSRG